MLISNRKDIIKVLDDLKISTFPCIYLLLNPSSQEIYVGETSDIRDRISQHKNIPPLNWKYCILIWNGRLQGMSIFDSDGLRKRLEFEMNNLLHSYSNYKVISTAYSVDLTINEQSRVEEILDEITYLLSIIIQPNLIDQEYFKSRLEVRKRLQIQKIPLRVKEEEVSIEGVVEKLKQAKLNVRDLNRAEKTFKIDNEVFFYRPGSLKRKGYQVTIRGTFLQHMRLNKGFLILNRGNVYIIPLKDINENFGKLLRSGQDTLDIFFDLRGGKVKCHNEEIGLEAYELNNIIQRLIEEFSKR